MAAASSSSSLPPQGVPPPSGKHEQKLAILNLFGESESLTSQSIYESYQFPSDEYLVGLFKSLESDGLVTSRTLSRTEWRLSEEGKDALQNGSPEFRAYQYIKNNPDCTKPQIDAAAGKVVGQIGWSQCLRLGWISLDQGKASIKIEVLTDITVDQISQLLQASAENNADSLKGLDTIAGELKKRKLVNNVVVKSYLLTKTAKFSTSLPRPIKEMTLKVLESGEWKTSPMKPFNLNSLGAPLSCGYLHPLMKVRSMYQEIFLEMGFEEMPTSQYVENSFWNFRSEERR